MAERPTRTIREIFRPWWMRWFAGPVAAISVYDTVGGQLELPTIRAIIGMSGALLPWWGWLLVLQAIFVAGLFDYVRRNVNAPPPQSAPLDATGKIAEFVDRVQLMADAIDNLVLLERLEGLEDDIAAQCSSLEGEWAKGAEIAKQEGVALTGFYGAWTGYTTSLPAHLKQLYSTISQRAGIEIDVESATGYINNPAASVPGDEAIKGEQTKHTYRRFYHQVKEATQQAGRAASQIEQMRRTARNEISEILDAVRRPVQ